MQNWYTVEADGFSGGIWLLWEDDRVKVTIIHAQSQSVHVVISHSMGDHGVSQLYMQVQMHQQEQHYGRI